MVVEGADRLRAVRFDRSSKIGAAILVVVEDVAGCEHDRLSVKALAERDVHRPKKFLIEFAQDIIVPINVPREKIDLLARVPIECHREGIILPLREVCHIRKIDRAAVRSCGSAQIKSTRTING